MEKMQTLQTFQTVQKKEIGELDLDYVSTDISCLCFLFNSLQKLSLVGLKPVL